MAALKELMEEDDEPTEETKSDFTDEEIADVLEDELQIADRDSQDEKKKSKKSKKKKKKRDSNCVSWWLIFDFCSFD